MVTEVVMTVWIRLVYGSEKAKDQDVDEAHGKSEGVYSKEQDTETTSTTTVSNYCRL